MSEKSYEDERLGDQLKDMKSPFVKSNKIIPPKTISEMTKLKLENINLKLSLLQLQHQQVVVEKMAVVEEELKRLKCKPEEWQLDERNGMIVNKPKEVSK